MTDRTRGPARVPGPLQPLVRAVPGPVRRPVGRRVRALDRRLRRLDAERAQREREAEAERAREEREELLELEARAEHGMPQLDDAPVRLLIAPVNSAGQGYAWARTAERHGPGVRASCLSLVNRFDFPADYRVEAATFVTDAWGSIHERYVLSTYSHVVAEAARPLFGVRHGTDISADLPLLDRAGIAVALLSHGSDTRIPSRHAERERFSPFRDSDWDLVPRLETGARWAAALLGAYPGHVLVSTPDMLDDIPDATWCPVVIDLDRWRAASTLMDRAVPVVVHVPSHSRLKGSELIDPILFGLAERGVIDYRRMEGLAAAAMVTAYRDADIVVDQVRLGIYGVAACEGMAAGRVVIGHVAPHVRQRVMDRTGLRLPIVQADPETLGDVLHSLLADRTGAAAIAAEGPEFVGAVHDGRMAADALTPFLAGASP